MPNPNSDDFINLPIGKVALADSTGKEYNLGNPLPTTATLNVGDIEIGAVEIKNATDDTRAVVGNTNSAPGPGIAVLVGQYNATPPVFGNTNIGFLQLGADGGLRVTDFGVIYGVIGDGRDIVATAGIREPLANQQARYIIITAETDNTGTIVIGGNTCVAALPTRQGTPLTAGDSLSMFVPGGNLQNIFFDSTVSGDGITYTFFN